MGSGSGSMAGSDGTRSMMWDAAGSPVWRTRPASSSSTVPAAATIAEVRPTAASPRFRRRAALARSVSRDAFEAVAADFFADFRPTLSPWSAGPFADSFALFAAAFLAAFAAALDFLADFRATFSALSAAFFAAFFAALRAFLPVLGTPAGVPAADPVTPVVTSVSPASGITFLLTELGHPRPRSLWAPVCRRRGRRADGYRVLTTR